MYKYRQIADQLAEEIREGVYGEGDKLPDQRTLAKTFAVSFLTVNKAVSTLVDEQVLVKRQGSGTFVNVREPVPKRGHIAFIHEIPETILATHSFYMFLSTEFNLLANGAAYSFEMFAGYDMAEGGSGKRFVSSLKDSPNPMLKQLINADYFDGLVLFMHGYKHLAGELAELNIPYTCIGGDQPKSVKLNNLVGIDGYANMTHVLDYLVREQGCRNIAIAPKLPPSQQAAIHDYMVTNDCQLETTHLEDLVGAPGKFDGYFIDDDYFALNNLALLSSLGDEHRLVVQTNWGMALPLPGVKLVVDSRKIARIAWNLLKKEIESGQKRKAPTLVQAALIRDQ